MRVVIIGEVRNKWGRVVESINIYPVGGALGARTDCFCSILNLNSIFFTYKGGVPFRGRRAF